MAKFYPLFDAVAFHTIVEDSLDTGGNLIKEDSLKNEDDFKMKTT